MSTKVIIPQRNEPLAAWTAKRVLETAPSVDEVIIVNDGEQPMPCKESRRLRVLTPWKDWKGTAPARDAGIMAAGSDCDYIILLDAHMNFPAGFDWAARLTDRCSTLDDQAIVSPGSCILNHKTKQMQVKDTEKGMAFGTTMTLMSGGEKKGGRTTHHMVFESKWRPKYGSLPGETQSVLGACYCFSRDWYINDLGRPWLGMEHWGTLEQSLTIPNWLAGGICYVEPFVIGHLYRTGHQVPYRQDNAMRWYNKFRLVDVLPMSEKLREKLLAHLMKNPEVMQRHADIKLAMDRNSAENKFLRAHLADYDVTVEDYFEEWEAGSPGRMYVRDIKDALDDRNVSYKSNAKKTALAKLLCDTLADEMRGNRPCFGIDYPPGDSTHDTQNAEPATSKPEAGTRPYLRNEKVEDPGVPCKHCRRPMHLLDDIEVTHTYPNGNRRIICKHCSMPQILTNKETEQNKNNGQEENNGN